jgi:hypothetical protein
MSRDSDMEAHSSELGQLEGGAPDFSPSQANCSPMLKLTVILIHLAMVEGLSKLGPGGCDETDLRL